MNNGESGQIIPRFTWNDTKRMSRKTRCYVGSWVAEPGDRMDLGSSTFFLGGRGLPAFKFRICLKFK